jgi:GH25 family lysozyme M1 (1,4-beta-N-acetylmuramidase)
MNANHFADLSAYQERFDAIQYRKSGAPLVALKATEGATFTDPVHHERALHAHEAGLRVWHYHFARPDFNPDGTGEMANFWRQVEPVWRTGDHVVLDLEIWPKAGRGAMPDYTGTLDEHLISISGHGPIAYTDLAMIQEAPEGWHVASGLWWVAWYSGVLHRLGPRRKLVAQQTREDGRFPGIGVCDENILTRAGQRLLKR